MLNPGSSLEDHPDGTGNLNAIVNTNWSVLESWLNPADVITVRWDNGTPGNSGTVLTASAAVFETGSDWVGAFIFFKTDKTTATIASVSSTTVAAASTSGNIAAQQAIIFRSTATKFTAIARALMKMPQIGAAHDAKIPAWSNALQKFVFVTRPGFAFAAGRIPFGAGAGNDLASSADLTWDDSTKLLNVGGQAKFENTVAEDVEADAAFTGSETPDFALGNIFNLTLTGNATINNPTNVKEGALYKLIFRQDGTGGRTLAWGANFKFPDGFNFVNTTASSITVFYALAVSTTELICWGTCAKKECVFHNMTAVGNITTGEDDLMSVSIPAGLLSKDGDSIEFFAAGTSGNNANTKRVRVKFGASTIFDSGAIQTTQDWVIRGAIIRTGATTQKTVVHYCLNASSASQLCNASLGAGETLANAITLKLTGEATATDDVVQQMWKGTYVPASA